MKYLGYRPDLYPSLLYRLVYPINFLICTWFILSSLWISIDKIDNLPIATENLSQSILTLTTAAKMTIFYMFHKSSVGLVEGLQQCVDESE